MMRRNLPHYYEAPVGANRSPGRSSSRKERSPTWHRISHRGSFRPSEEYSFHPRSLKHLRSPSPPPYYPFPLTKRLRDEAGTLPARVHERFNSRWIGRELQQGVHDREEELSRRNYTDDTSSRSRHHNSPSDRDHRSRHRYSPQCTGDIRDEKKVNEGRDRNHSRGNDRSMHREYETESMWRTKAKDITGHMSSTSRYDTSDQHRRSRRRCYSPQHSYDTRYVEKVIEGHERNPSRGNQRTMHIEKDNERMERMTAEESSSYRSSRSGHFTSPSTRYCRSRHTYYSPQHAGDTRDKEEKVIEGHERNYRRESDRSMHREKHLDRENETGRMDRRTGKDNSGLRISKSVHWQSTSPLNGHKKKRHQIHSSQPDGDTGTPDEVPELREARDGIDVNDSVAMMRAAEEVLEAQKNQKPSFVLSGKLAVEANRFRGDSPKKKLISSYMNDGDEDYDKERTQGVYRLNLAPRKKKLLVFDLNGLLVYRVLCFNKRGIPRDRTPDGQCGQHLVFKRAFAEEFLLFCLERFEVGIWTSALEKNVYGVLDCVMEKLRSRLVFLWCQDQCTDSGFKSPENEMKPLFFKELKKVWDHFEGKFSASDTLLIDDQPYKALLNPPYTGIFMDPYIPDNGTDSALDPRKELGEYLDGLAFADDVQLYLKNNPFGQPAISSAHPDWNFYSGVLRKLGKDVHY